jgi:acyl dehydratase
VAPTLDEDGPRGLWFEEFVEGRIHQHRPRRTVTEADNVLFTTMTMNPQSLHLDETYAAGTEFGRRLVNSLYTLSTVVGLSVAELTERTTVANLGFTEVRFPHPMFHGDTLAASTLVLAKRVSRSRPLQGIVELEHRGHNQDGVLVCSARRSALMHCRPVADA